jgi:hypothetical protein
MTVAMDIDLDDDIASIVSVKNEFFYKHFIEEWSDLDSNDDSDLMLAMTSILHEDNEAQLPQWGGLCRPSQKSGPQPRGRARAGVQRLLSP